MVFIICRYIWCRSCRKVVRGYHCPPVQQPYWNTVYLNDFPDEELLNMIDMAYDTVFSKFSKKEQKNNGRIVLKGDSMKRLIVIIGPNAVGKTTAAKCLVEKLPQTAYVDSDWCRCKNPFLLTDITNSSLSFKIRFK